MTTAFTIESVDAFRHRISRNPLFGMRTDVVVYATAKLLKDIEKDLALRQAINVASLPGIVGPSLAMPDIHQGYGFPIGGVAATDFHEGVVSPGGVGFDINCGVRLATTSLTRDDVAPRLNELVQALFRIVPCGTGGEGRLRLTEKELEEVLRQGAAWMVRIGYGEFRDLEFAEEQGRLQAADPARVSERAKHRGRCQLATLGSGNHFVEVQYVEQIHNEDAARAMNLRPNQITVMVHCGSRGLGHQVCTDYVADMGAAMKRYNISVSDRQLACVPVQSPEGQSYLAAMNAAANYAWANRQGILHSLRSEFRTLFGTSTRVDLLYDVCHNMAKREWHLVDGVERDVLVHRKGATRAFPPGHGAVPAAYRHIGQPVIIPGSMGTASWVLVGAPRAMRETFGSVCHGAGRQLSRAAAKRGRDAQVEERKLRDAGICVRSESRDGILEEVPEAYKDVDEVIEVVHLAGLACKVARLRPLGVIKG
jgi:tRNA-splicing ligase RtcB